jgi:hypothetical protein
MRPSVCLITIIEIPISTCLGLVTGNAKPSEAVTMKGLKPSSLTHCSSSSRVIPDILRPSMNKSKQISKLSISVPAELKPLISQRAAQLDLTVSQYIRWLAKGEMLTDPLKVQGGNDVITTQYER